MDGPDLGLGLSHDAGTIPPLPCPVVMPLQDHHGLGPSDAPLCTPMAPGAGAGSGHRPHLFRAPVPGRLPTDVTAGRLPDPIAAGCRPP